MIPVQEPAPTPLLLGSAAQVLDEQARAHVAHADALDFLRSLPPAACDILVTDPPYSSGGMVRGDRAKAGLASSKYGRAEQTAEIHGDTMDGRSYAFWSMLWMRAARSVLKPGAFALIFTDWRLPAIVRASVPRTERHAVCSKPVALMEALLGPCPVGGVVLDPFVGWGATPVAALRTGRRFLGCEISEVNRATTIARLEGAEVRPAARELAH